MRVIVAFFSWLIAKVQLPQRRVVDEQVIEATKRVSVGDIVLTRQRWSLANWFIPGFWTHAAVVIGKNLYNEFLVLEATTHKSHIVELDGVIRSKDYFAIYSPHRKPSPMTVAIKAKELDGIDYDFFFAQGNSYQYCSEIVVTLYGFLGKYEFKTETILGEEYLDPDTFCLTDDFYCKLDTRGEL